MFHFYQNNNICKIRLPFFDHYFIDNQRKKGYVTTLKSSPQAPKDVLYEQ
ncbi:hypothetical protein HMPREF1870_01399 [Bacteroidales bacterium KA00344]|nr:hypothetical protein HMPREF1870_01399 [Bacteroidales bacterium KA00344]